MAHPIIPLSSFLQAFPSLEEVYPGSEKKSKRITSECGITPTLSDRAIASPSPQSTIPEIAPHTPRKQQTPPDRSQPANFSSLIRDPSASALPELIPHEKTTVSPSPTPKIDPHTPTKQSAPSAFPTQAAPSSSSYETPEKGPSLNTHFVSPYKAEVSIFSPNAQNSLLPINLAKYGIASLMFYHDADALKRHYEEVARQVPSREQTFGCDARKYLQRRENNPYIWHTVSQSTPEKPRDLNSSSSPKRDLNSSSSLDVAAIEEAFQRGLLKGIGPENPAANLIKVQRRGSDGKIKTTYYKVHQNPNPNKQFRIFAITGTHCVSGPADRILPLCKRYGEKTPQERTLISLINFIRKNNIHSSLAANKEERPPLTSAPTPPTPLLP